MQQAAIHAGNLLVKLLLISMLVARQRGRCRDRRHPAPGGKPFRRAEHDGAMTEKGTTTDVALGYAISIDDYSGGPAAAVQVCCTATARLALLLSHPTLFSLTIGSNDVLSTYGDTKAARDTIEQTVVARPQ